jgi:regulator of nucleoside diphosphate kinase
MTRRTIYVSENDRALLAELPLSGGQAERSPYARFMHALKDELKKARILPANKMPADVVTINSTVSVTYLDSGVTDEFTLVMPTEANGSERISVLSPLGMAILGYRVGDNISWGPVDRLIQIRVDRVEKNPRGAAVKAKG